MKHWDTLLELSCKKHDSINKVLQPLQHYFDIQGFGYFNISRRGQFSYLTNKPEIMREYVKRGFISQDPFYRHPNFYQNQLLILDSTVPPIQSDSELRQYLYQDVGYKGGFFYFDITPEGVEGYEFGYYNHSLRTNRFWQDKKLFDAFFPFFKQETKDLRSLIQNYSVSLPHEMGDLFFCPPDFVMDSEHKLEFLKTINLTKTEFSNLHFTPREIECIALYLQRKTAPETARILHLSTRTIENYFETIKQKLNCHHKSEIYEKIKALVSHGYYANQLGQFFGIFYSD